MRDELGLHVLALDWSPVQSEGAIRREKIAKKSSRRPKTKQNSSECPALHKGSLTYETLLIDTQSLLEAVDGWVASVGEAAEEQVPVLLVALHACGSLTLDIFRAFGSKLKVSGAASRWEPAAALVVGCCYNRLASAGKSLWTKLMLCILS